MCEENPPNAFRIGGIVLWGDERDGTAAVPYGGGVVRSFFSLLALSVHRRPLRRPMAASSPRRGAKGAVQQQRCGLGAPRGCGDGSANQSVNDTAPNAVCEYCIKFQRQNSAKCRNVLALSANRPFSIDLTAKNV